MVMIVVGGRNERKPKQIPFKETQGGCSPPRMQLLDDAIFWIDSLGKCISSDLDYKLKWIRKQETIMRINAIRVGLLETKGAAALLAAAAGELVAVAVAGVGDEVLDELELEIEFEAVDVELTDEARDGSEELEVDDGEATCDTAATLVGSDELDEELEFRDDAVDIDELLVRAGAAATATSDVWIPDT